MVRPFTVADAADVPVARERAARAIDETRILLSAFRQGSGVKGKESRLADEGTYIRVLMMVVSRLIEQFYDATFILKHIWKAEEMSKVRPRSLRLAQ